MNDSTPVGRPTRVERVPTEGRLGGGMVQIRAALPREVASIQGRGLLWARYPTSVGTATFRETRWWEAVEMEHARGSVRRLACSGHVRLRVALALMWMATGVVPSQRALGVGAQVPAAVKFDVRAVKGQSVSPVYEGWYQLDGATYALFGYFNRNLEEVVDVPVGVDNSVQPGSIDQAQPTRFFPGRHYGVFAIAVPKDAPRTEMKWTLTAAGQTHSIPAFLDQLYFVFPQREDGGTSPGNTPPVVRFEPSGPAAQGPLGVTTSRTATVERPLTLEAWVADDGLPPPPRVRVAAPPGSALSARPQGLSIRWSVYRGPGSASFSPQTPPVEGGKAQTAVTFRDAGAYVLHLLASDSRSGTMCCWTNGYVKVVAGVNPKDEPLTGAKP